MSANTQPPGIERRFARVSGVSGLSTLLSIVLQLISVPVCLRFWGGDAYGAWLALFAAFTWMRTVDGGYIGYVGNRLNMLYHQDAQALRTTLASAVWGVGLLGVLQLLVLVVLYATGSMGILVGMPAGSSATTEALLALLVLTGLWILSGSYIGIVHRFLIPAGLMYQATWWSIAFQVAQFSALIGAAVGRLSLLQAALLVAVSQAVIYVGSAVYIRFKLPEYFPWWAGPSRTVGLRDLRLSIPIVLSGIVQQGGISGLVMLVAAVLGAAAVPAYATVRTLCNLWVTLINVLTEPLLPEVVRFHVKHAHQKQRAIHRAHGCMVNSVVNVSILERIRF